MAFSAALPLMSSVARQVQEGHASQRIRVLREGLESNKDVWRTLLTYFAEAAALLVGSRDRW
jgi:hypothetical protein